MVRNAQDVLVFSSTDEQEGMQGARRKIRFAEEALMDQGLDFVRARAGHVDVEQRRIAGRFDILLEPPVGAGLEPLAHGFVTVADILQRFLELRDVQAATNAVGERQDIDVRRERLGQHIALFIRTQNEVLLFAPVRL